MDDKDISRLVSLVEEGIAGGHDSEQPYWDWRACEREIHDALRKEPGIHDDDALRAAYRVCRAVERVFEVR